MPDDSRKILKKIRPTRVILPMAIGLGVVFYLLYKEFDPAAFTVLKFTWYTLAFLIISIIMMVCRDLGYMIRLRILAGRELSWRKIFNIIMLWEFTSAITPSAIGGTSVAIFYVHKEGISVGRSSAIVLVTSFLDELYFLIMFPLMFFIISGSELFTIQGADLANGTLSFTNKYFYFAVIGYSLKFIFTCFIVYGLFINPRGLKWLILWTFRISWLRKWRHGANQTGYDLISASKELRNKSFFFWIKAFLASFFSWTARYWVVNFLLLALVFGSTGLGSEAIYSFKEHILIFARQLVMWVMMIVMPTPGGSGFAEYIFNEYLGEFIPVAGFVAMMAFLWRLVSYYPYLLMGVFVIPGWVNKKLIRN